jgi:hypothetical protein
MARKQSTRPRPGVDHPDPVASALGAALNKADAFDGVFYEMQAELCALHCAIETIRGTDWEHSDTLSAVLTLLERTHKSLDRLHANFADFAPHQEAQS